MIIDRPLGKSGLRTPPLVLGGNPFGWTIDSATTFAVLDAFVAGGGRMIDTADVYWSIGEGFNGGHSETLIGEWLHRRGHREDVLVATKVGMEMDGDEGLDAARIARMAERSLKRLKTDYIDLYFAHQDFPDTPLEEVLGAFDKLVRDGKVRAIAASNHTAARVAEAISVSRQCGFAEYTVVEPNYSLVARDGFEGALQKLCLDENIGCISYFSLASGFLTGKYRNRTDIEGNPRAFIVDDILHLFSPYGMGVLAALDAVAEETAATAAQVALAWLMAQPGVTAPIASATSVVQVEQLLGAMRLHLNPHHLGLLAEASRPMA